MLVAERTAAADALDDAVLDAVAAGTAIDDAARATGTSPEAVAAWVAEGMRMTPLRGRLSPRRHRRRLRRLRQADAEAGAVADRGAEMLVDAMRRAASAGVLVALLAEVSRLGEPTVERVLAAREAGRALEALRDAE